MKSNAAYERQPTRTYQMVRVFHDHLAQYVRKVHRGSKVLVNVGPPPMRQLLHTVKVLRNFRHVPVPVLLPIELEEANVKLCTSQGASTRTKHRVEANLGDQP